MEDKKSVDLIGIGEIANAIPDSVYENVSNTVLTTFEKLVSPITETTSGFGKYIKQKFDNMVEVEKVLLSYSMENARRKLENKGVTVCNVSHPKTIVRILEELSQETDSLLNEMWTNLLCTELETSKSHPFFINVLSSFSVDEALLLEGLKPFHLIGEVRSDILFLPRDIESFIIENSGNVREWNFSCRLLLEYGLADTIAPQNHQYGSYTAILYRTELGDELIKAVSD